MGIIEEDPPHIQSGSTRKRNSRDKKKPHQEVKKKKIAKKGSGIKRSQLAGPNLGGSEIAMSLTDLPPNVLVEILARLPLRTLFLARSVCRTFGFLTTSNPHFFDLHSANAAQILVFQFGASRAPSSLLRIADNELDYKDFQLKPPLFQLPKTGTYFLVNSCNGLLYFMRNGYKDLHSLVCNPVTSEYIIIPDALPDPRIRLHSRTENLWLGFSPGTDQYKVLRMFCWKSAAGPFQFAAQVFVIGSGLWRDIYDTPPWHHLLGDLAQTLVNGLLYWHDGWWPSVISFDFEREKFGEVALPPEFQYERYIITKYKTSIGVLGGCLCLSCNHFYDHRLDLWVLRKCGNQESWTKEFVIDTSTLGPRRGPVCGQFMPLQFLRNGKILMLLRRNALVCYDPKTETLRYFRLHRDDFGHKVVALTPSLVPLKDTLKVEVEKVLTQLRPRGDEKEL